MDSKISPGLLAPADAHQRVDAPEGADVEGRLRACRNRQPPRSDACRGHRTAMCFQRVDRRDEAWNRIGSMKPTSAISSTLASRSSPPRLSAKAWRLLAPGLRRSTRLTDRRGPARASSASRSVPGPARVAIFASRSQAAQHISADEVCTRARVRNSHIPASGWSCTSQGLLAYRLEPREIVERQPRRNSRRSWKDCDAPEHARCRTRRAAKCVVAPGCPRRTGPIAAIALRRCGHVASSGRILLEARGRTAAGHEAAARRRAPRCAASADSPPSSPSFGQAVERAHHEEGIAQPAVAIVPVAPAARPLRAGWWSSPRRSRRSRRTGTA